jgi:hypothetical protein
METSGRLHTLWPQNKRLRTPWTTDWMHTRQDSWIQTELAFALAKNATIPNPFEIMSLHSTRKENNWKTEETLARAVVTLETERIKGSSTWLCWRWWPKCLIEAPLCMDILKIGYSMTMDVRCIRYRDNGVAGLNQNDAFCYGNS